jgi:hypothetical protein
MPLHRPARARSSLMLISTHNPALARSFSLKLRTYMLRCFLRPSLRVLGAFARGAFTVLETRHQGTYLQG